MALAGLSPPHLVPPIYRSKFGRFFIWSSFVILWEGGSCRLGSIDSIA